MMTVWVQTEGSHSERRLSLRKVAYAGAPAAAESTGRSTRWSRRDLAGWEVKQHYTHVQYMYMRVYFYI